MLSAALAYLRLGWSIIPCKRRDKTPLVTWQDYISRTPTEGEVQDWWRRWPDANIAAITGSISGFVVVDVDTKRGGSTDSLADTGRVTRTGSGGFHLFYAHPGRPVANQVGSNGIDVRGDGGYVIVPPSIHQNGQKYTWLSEGNLAAAPDWVKRPKHSAEKPRGTEHWLADLISLGTEVGRRNDDVARLAGYLAGKQMPVDIAQAFISQWMATQASPLPSAELHTTVQSVFRTALSRKKTPTKPVPKAGNMFISAKECMLRFGAAEVSWLVEDWLPDETIAFTASPPGGLKTWLMLDLAVSVATGKPFLGSCKVAEPGPVMLFQQEDYIGQTMERLAVIIIAKFGLTTPTADSLDGVSVNLPELPIHMHIDRALRFDNSDFLGALEREIAETRPRLVIIDPLYSAASMDNYGQGSVDEMFILKKWRDKYHASFVIAHHTRKSAESWDRQEMWGSQFLNAFLETGWQIRKNPDEESIVVKRHFKRAPPGPPQKLSFTIQTKLPCLYSVEAVDATEEELAQAAAGTITGTQVYLEQLDQHGPCTAADLAKHMSKNRSSVSRMLKKLEANGEVKKDEKHLWFKVQMPEF